MVTIFSNEHVRQQAGAQPDPVRSGGWVLPLAQSCRSACTRAWAAPAGSLGSGREHTPGSRRHPRLKLQRAVAVRQAVSGQNRPFLARQMAWQRPSWPASGQGRRGCRLRRRGSRRGSADAAVANSSSCNSNCSICRSSFSERRPNLPAATWQSAIASVRSQPDGPPVVRPGVQALTLCLELFRLQGKRLMLGEDESSWRLPAGTCRDSAGWGAQTSRPQYARYP